MLGPNRDGHIGKVEFMSCMIIVVGSKCFDLTISILDKEGQTAGWLLNLLSASVAVIGILVMLMLMRRHPGQHLIEIMRNCLGKWLAALLGTLILFLILADAVSVLYQYTNMTHLILLPETPDKLISAALIVLCSYIGYQGIEVISRSALLIVPTLLLVFLLAFLLTLPSMHWDYLFPILGSGWNLVPSGFRLSGIYGEFLFVAILGSFFRKTSTFTKGAWISFGLTGLILTFTSLLTTSVFDYPINHEQVLPFFQIARNIHLGRFIEHVDALFAFFGILSGIARISLVLYITCLLLAQVSKLHSYRPLVPAISVHVYFLSWIPKSIVDVYHWREQYLIPCGFLAVVCLPVMIFVVERIRFRKERPT